MATFTSSDGSDDEQQEGTKDKKDEDSDDEQDEGSDDEVQGALSRALKGVTVIAVAHRLRTVIRCDKVLALAEGRVAEFDAPAALLRGGAGLFSRLVADTGGEAEGLRVAATEAEAARAAKG